MNQSGGFRHGAVHPTASALQHQSRTGASSLGRDDGRDVAFRIEFTREVESGDSVWT